jgi:hypothetical protein
MANPPVTGNGPLEFTDTFGRHVSIPLTAFSVDPVKGIVPDDAWASVVGALPASALFAYAVKEKLIKPAPAPSAFPAMIVTAADPGPGGNNIKVQIVAGAPNSDPTKATFSIQVTETDTYDGLTAATISSVLGTCNAAGVTVTPGSNPGLVQVLQGSVDPIGAPLAVTALLSGNPAKVEIDQHASPARVFTLVAKKPGADGAFITVKITPAVSSPPSNPETFSLVATWQKPPVAGVTIGTLQTEVQSILGYEIAVSTPASGAFSVPAASTTTLSGGATGVAASATIFTGS